MNLFFFCGNAKWQDNHNHPGHFNKGAMKVII